MDLIYDLPKTYDKLYFARLANTVGNRCAEALTHIQEHITQGYTRSKEDGQLKRNVVVVVPGMMQ
jgi:hypothetical protein